jgi:YegS/Rv2252/BmrU family lipid kinase
MNNKLKPFIIVNPKSGRGIDEKKWASITLEIHNNLGAFDFEFTRGLGDAIGIAEKEAKQGREFIIAMGGDGTISEVATGILRSEKSVELGILPRGTGGDFRRSLNLPKDLSKAARQLREGASRKIDAGRIRYLNNEGKEAVRYFVNTASFGMSGGIATRANESSKKYLGGRLTFAAATLKSTLADSNSDVYVKIDQQEKKRMKVASVCIANGRYWGGGMKIAPDAKLNDGYLDVVMIGDLSVIEKLTKSYRLYSGTHLSIDKVGFALGTRIEATPVNGSNPVLIEVDGEAPGQLPATIEVLPGALRIRCL